MDWLAQLQVIMGTGIAMVLGGMVGFERELKDRPAGFRTHMLVAGAAALLVGIGLVTLHNPAVVSVLAPEQLRMDPLRLVESVIAGVAFIGAGTIFASRSSKAVVGITTASSLLMVAVIGIATGLQYYVLAVSATVLTLIVLSVLKWVEHRFRDAQPDTD
ncbi:MgtC/SapB family protein [Lysobacter sp. H23M47]|uniref:MgtC/SapB family protein n=1 Tax=Lysobacter sp. H23M47 TaxID=2781024 RepID=UPI00187F4EFB|nr:MgtC/SapB family protein [Lysobacter sp. H23M47]QOW23570.1 MgtC/SapB family protein [Lysobacter sp. H23M47]